MDILLDRYMINCQNRLYQYMVAGIISILISLLFNFIHKKANGRFKILFNIVNILSLLLYKVKLAQHRVTIFNILILTWLLPITMPII